MRTYNQSLMRMIILAFLISTKAIIYAQEQSTLVLWHADGTQTRIALYKKPQITFQGENVNIISPVLNLQYPSTNVLKFTYEGKPSSVDIPKNDAYYHQEGECIVFDKSITSNEVALYTSSGTRIPIQIHETGRGLSLSLSNIPSGIYLLSIEGKTIKFAKP